MRTFLPLLVPVLLVPLLLSGCSNEDTVAANVALQFPDGGLGFIWARLYGPVLLAALAILTGVIVIVAASATVRAIRRGRPVRRWPLVTAVIASVVLIAIAVGVLVLTLVLDPTVTFAVGSFG